MVSLPLRNAKHLFVHELLRSEECDLSSQIARLSWYGAGPPDGIREKTHTSPIHDIQHPLFGKYETSETLDKLKRPGPGAPYY